jgi:hypothetical protein
MNATSALTEVARADHAGQSDAALTIAAAIDAVKRLVREYEAAQSRSAAFWQRWKDADCDKLTHEARAAVPPPAVLVIPNPPEPTDLAQMVVVRRDGSQETHNYHRDAWVLTSEDAVMQHVSGDAAKAAPLLAALKRWESDRRKAALAALPADIRAEMPEKDKASRERSRARGDRDRAIAALLKLTPSTPAEALAQLQAAAAADGYRFAKASGKVGSQYDIEVDNLLGAAVRALRSFASAPAAPAPSTPPPTAPTVTDAWASLRGGYKAAKAGFNEASSDGSVLPDDEAEARKEAVRPALNAAWAAVFNYAPTNPLEWTEKRNILCDQESAPRELLNADTERLMAMDAERLGSRDADAAVKALGDPDAQFLHWWDERIALLPQMCAHEEEGPEDAAVWDRLGEIDRLIHTTPALGLLGAMVKLRLSTATDLGLFSVGQTQHDREGVFKALAALEAEHLRRAPATWTSAELKEAHGQWVALNAEAEALDAEGGDEDEFDAVRGRADRVEDELIAARCTDPLIAAAKLDIAWARIRREGALSISNWSDAADIRVLSQVRAYLRGEEYFDAYAIVEEYRALGGDFTLHHWQGRDWFGTRYPLSRCARSSEIESMLSMDRGKSRAVWDEMVRRGAPLYSDESRPEKEPGDEPVVFQHEARVEFGMAGAA